MIDDDARCLCGSGETYAACCGRFHGGRGTAPTAETLMRSRFSAFAAHDEPYLLQTWHPSTRPASVGLDPALRWYRLDVHGTSGGGPFDDEGRVDFTAHWRGPAGAREPSGRAPGSGARAAAGSTWTAPWARTAAPRPRPGIVVPGSRHPPNAGTGGRLANE